MKRSVIILLHIGYWLLYVLLLMVLFAPIWVEANADKIHTFDGFMHYIFFSPASIGAILPAIISFYSFYVLLFEKFLKRRKILLLFLTGSLSCFIAALFGGVGLTISLGKAGLFSDGWASAIPITLLMFLIAFIHGVIGLVMKGFITFYGDIKWKEELNKKNYEMELTLIKNQLNPHFLFNTINNIDVLIEKDAEKASYYLNKLSDMMRFMLYETKTEKIPLQKELTYIEKYIELQKIRTSYQEYIQYSITGNSENIEIAPMLYIPFLENAFKYAEFKKQEHAISIRFEIGKEKITFGCRNAYNEKSNTQDDFSGLGNQLIKRRLELLYPEKHLLEIHSANGFYEVKLVISLDENKLHHH
ncbi:MAG: histidine kinase [Fimbriimonadaceae bacterium]|nr:histidine kinase [Chitinophagales bacterium]